tara:strand:+ start:984 stop:1967 length:984 start_codon:yes stop_codon:yes gene_type:complete
MSILRGGKRIGGHDIRIGIPRDRSLENVEKDPRLKQQVGGNPASTVGRMQALVNEAEGFARKARFYVEFQLPTGAPDIGIGVSFGDVEPEIPPYVGEENNGFSGMGQLKEVHKANTKRVQLFCSQITMPDRTIKMESVRHGAGPRRQFAYDFESADITATFYADKFLRERTYFEMWQGAAINLQTFNHNYYDSYVAPINIFQLGSFASQQERDDVTYAVHLYDCFPTVVGPVEYSHEDNQVQTFQVTFTYRYWTNFFINQAGNIDIGKSEQTRHEQKTLDKGIWGRLPPEIRRAGRGVVEDLRRRIPIGTITGGRVFPPFKIPPLNI